MDSMMNPPLRINYDKGWDELVIEGVKFSGDFFRKLEHCKVGDRFEVMSRQDNNLILKKLNREEI